MYQLLHLFHYIDADEYMAFGISGSTSRSQMVGADVIVTYYTAAAEPMAVDYKLTAQAQVRLMACEIYS